MTNAFDPAAYIRELEGTGRYRVLEKLAWRPQYDAPDGAATKWAMFIDVETTGLQLEDDVVIQLAAVMFEYGPATGRVFNVEPPVSWLEDPGRPIPAQVSELTGLTDEMVAGQRIDDHALGQMLNRSALVIAHNAEFDRGFVERRLPDFASAYWACSQRDIDWDAEGLRSHSLEWLLQKQAAMFFDGHRADADCVAGVHLLSTELPKSKRPVLQALLETARVGAYRVYAVGSPFDTKDLLKARRYRWDADRKCWWREIPAPERDQEEAWLASEVYRGGGNRAEFQRIDPKRRFARG